MGPPVILRFALWSAVFAAIGALIAVPCFIAPNLWAANMPNLRCTPDMLQTTVYALGLEGAAYVLLSWLVFVRR